MKRRRRLPETSELPEAPTVTVGVGYTAVTKTRAEEYRTFPLQSDHCTLHSLRSRWGQALRHATMASYKIFGSNPIRLDTIDAEGDHIFLSWLANMQTDNPASGMTPVSVFAEAIPRLFGLDL